MVIVDSRGVDQDTGKDQDPEHEQAEVEASWPIALTHCGTPVSRETAARNGLTSRWIL